jgi:hemerythrin-like domain-containing protein
MREHGVLERVLVVWHEADGPLRRGEPIDVAALRASVELVQRFIERYHERLEEDFVFPRLEQAGRERGLVRTLRHQHEVGRGITAEVALTLGGRLDESSRTQVADRLAAYARMYLAHASREDTIVFPAFRELSGADYAERGEQFEEREHEIIGEGGFDRAVAEVARIERAFGSEDLSRFTPDRAPG